jgi:hypothetical protein
MQTLSVGLQNAEPFGALPKSLSEMEPLFSCTMYNSRTTSIPMVEGIREAVGSEV